MDKEVLKTIDDSVINVLQKNCNECAELIISKEPSLHLVTTSTTKYSIAFIENVIIIETQLLYTSFYHILLVADVIVLASHSKNILNT